MSEFEALAVLLKSLVQPAALKGWLLLALCLGLSWLIVRLIKGGRHWPESIIFGDRLFDGVLFPVLALALAYGARWWAGGSALVEGYAGVFRLAIPILLSLTLIRLSVRVLRASFPQSGTVRQLERSISWVAWAAVILWLTGFLPLLLTSLEQVQWKMGGTTVNLRDLLEGLLSSGFVLVLALWVSAAVEARLIRGSGDALSLRMMASNLIRTVLLFVGLIIALGVAGIDLTALGVLGGAIGVGLGFGLQKIAANYVSGFVILAERSLRIGDMVKVDGFEGRITDIRTRFTVIRALNGRESVVPNETLITSRVENLSLADRSVLQALPITVDYRTDVPALQKQLTERVAAVPRVLSEPGPSVFLTDFGSDGLNLTINYWIEDPENGMTSVRSDVNLAVLEHLRSQGVEIPYPQRVVTLKRK